MDITLGPWKAEPSVEQNVREPLTKAMADEAKTTVKKAGHTPKEAVNGQAAASGFTIYGRITNVLTEGRSTQVKAIFEVMADGSFTNLQPVTGDATATRPMTAEDALRAMTESRVKKILDAIKAGRVIKAR